MKPIAVITNDIPATFQWLKKIYDIEINVESRTAKNKKGETLFVLISNKEQALAWEFSSYIVSPKYDFQQRLEQFIVSGIK